MISLYNKIDEKLQSAYVKLLKEIFDERLQSFKNEVIHFEKLEKFNKSINDLLLCPFDKLEQINDDFKIEDNDFKDFVLNKFLNYRNTRSNPKFCSFFKKLVTDIIKVCPYCEGYPLKSLIKNSKTKLYFQLDHHLNQKEFPFLQLSLFNLIPCCNNCNQFFGKQCKKDKGILNPYEDFDMDNMGKFKFETESLIRHYYGIEENNVKISFVNREQHNKGGKHIDNLKINEKFEQNHQENIAEMVRKKVVFKGVYFDYLAKEFKLNNTALIDMIYGYSNLKTYKGKRLNNKIMVDLMEDLGIFKHTISTKSQTKCNL